MLVCMWKECSQSCTSPEDLKSHLETHVTPDLRCLWTQCSRFGEKQPNKYALIAHLRKHSGDRPFKCQKCPKSYTRSDALNKHLKSHKQAEKSIEALAGRVRYLRLEAGRAALRLRVASLAAGRASRRLAVVSRKCIEVVRRQLAGAMPHTMPRNSFWEEFLRAPRWDPPGPRPPCKNSP